MYASLGVGFSEVDYALTPYGAVTLGDEVRSVSASVTAVVDPGFLSAGGTVAAGVLLSAGGELQVSNRAKLLVDVAVPLGDGPRLVAVFPGTRLFGDRYAVDVFGVVSFAEDDSEYDYSIVFAPLGSFSFTF